MEQMAIWSLTQERIDRLAKQIGDKEVEHLKLTNTSPKQLWTTDLDEFLAEWRYQLEDEAKRAKQLAGLGRRTSQKLRIQGKTNKGGAKKRKVEDDDESDTSYSAGHKKTATGKPKPSSMFDYLKRESPPRKPVVKKAAPKPAVKLLVNGIEQKPVARPPAEVNGLLLDGASDPVDESDEKFKVLEPVKKTAKETAKAVAPKTTVSKPAKNPVVKSDSEDNDDDVFAEIAKEAKTIKSAAPAGRQARAATRKPVKYANSDSDESDDNGDDLLGDMSKLVKGISNGIGDREPIEPGKTLFSATAPKLSNSHALVSKTKSSRSVVDLSEDEEDQTDYKNLVPKDSPKRPAARNAREVVLSDDEADSFDMAAPKAALKGSVAAAKPKAAVVPKLKKMANGVASAAVEKAKEKLVPLSPAAKAYAATQAKTKTKLAAVVAPPSAQPKPVARAAAAAAAPTKRAKKVIVSDDEDADDVDDIANEILDDDDEDEGSEVVPAASKRQTTASTAARPSRRTAATAGKSKYVIDDDDEDEDEVSEADYDDDDSK